MLRHLTSKIKSTGPITVAEYMREVLTNPVTVSLAPSFTATRGRQRLWVRYHATRMSHCASLVVFQGYYVRNNMLGPDGDFITSPEISQIFGEVRIAGVLVEYQ